MTAANTVGFIDFLHYPSFIKITSDKNLSGILNIYNSLMYFRLTEVQLIQTNHG
jgi:hypothetical protein